MKWNPCLNALIATTYICSISLLFRFVHDIRGGTPDSIIDPIGALSLLVFSVAVMAFLFFYRPVTLLIANKKEEALSYFGKTIATFGVITLIVFVIILTLK